MFGIAFKHHDDNDDDNDDEDDDEFIFALTHQPNVLVDPHIASFEALGTGVSPTVDRVIVRWQEIACSKGG